jgi:IS1 family transposase
MVDEAPHARYYFSELFAPYRALIYSPGQHTPMPNKSETYRVEGDNAELRHYLARLPIPLLFSLYSCLTANP